MTGDDPEGTDRNADAGASEDPVRDLVQQALGDEFRLLSILGRGGMGVVYLARQAGLERLVAVKVLSPKIAANDSHERFRREARMAARLTHPNILPVFAFGEAGDLLYIVMGYVRSETLADWLRHEGRLPLDRARRILADLASALDYAHRHGVIHRDIKPENILLDDESERVLLMDFGIARSYTAGNTMTVTGVAVGTPMYMSPEQASGERELDGRSDLYSLGLVAYEMLVGHPPFGGPNEKFLGEGLITAKPLAEVAPDVPEDLAKTIMRCLARDPDARWPDARSFGLAVTRGNAEAGVPDELREVSGFGSWALLWLVVWSVAAANSFVDHGSWPMLVLIALLVPIGFALQGWNVQRAGFSARQILYVGMWPPKWWGLWWPRWWRRPDDIWHALPHSTRLTRIALTLFFLVTASLVFAEHVAGLNDATAVGVALRYLQYALIVTTGLALITIVVHWRREGMGTSEIAGWLVGSTVNSSFWRRPQISAHLRRGSSGQPTGPSTPHEYLRAISDAADALTGPARAPGSDAISAARVLIPKIAAFDGELESLRRNVDPGEVMRVEERLALLGEYKTGDNDQEQMRVLLRRQLELLSRLETRQAQAVDQRAQLVDRLRALWTEVCQLRTMDALTPSLERIAHLRALCEAIERDGLEGSTP